MADDRSVLDGDEGNRQGARAPQCVDNGGFSLAAVGHMLEGSRGQVADRVNILRAFRPTLYRKPPPADKLAVLRIQPLTTRRKPLRSRTRCEGWL